jgi:hypothetical protein
MSRVATIVCCALAVCTFHMPALGNPRAARLRIRKQLSSGKWVRRSRFVPASKARIEKLTKQGLRVKTIGDKFMVRRYRASGGVGREGLIVEDWYRERDKGDASGESLLAAKAFRDGVGILSEQAVLSRPNREKLLDAAVAGLTKQSAKGSTDVYRNALSAAAKELRRRSPTPSPRLARLRRMPDAASCSICVQIAAACAPRPIG